MTLKLVDLIIGIAVEKGLEELFGDVLTENTRMLTIPRKLGFTATRQPDGITRVSFGLR